MLCKPVNFGFHIFGDAALPLNKVTGNRVESLPFCVNNVIALSLRPASHKQDKHFETFSKAV